MGIVMTVECVQLFSDSSSCGSKTVVVPSLSRLAGCFLIGIVVDFYTLLLTASQ